MADRKVVMSTFRVWALLLGILCVTAVYGKYQPPSSALLEDCVILGSQETQFASKLNQLGYNQRHVIRTDGRGWTVRYSAVDLAVKPARSYPHQLTLEFRQDGRLARAYGTINFVTVNGRKLTAGAKVDEVLSLLGNPSARTRLPNDCTALTYDKWGLRLVIDDTANYGLSGATLGTD